MTELSQRSFPAGAITASRLCSDKCLSGLYADLIYFLLTTLARKFPGVFHTVLHQVLFDPFPPGTNAPAPVCLPPRAAAQTFSVPSTARINKKEKKNHTFEIFFTTLLFRRSLSSLLFFTF